VALPASLLLLAGSRRVWAGAAGGWRGGAGRAPPMDGEQRLGRRRPGVRRGRKTDAAQRIRRTGKNGDYNRFDPAAHMVRVVLSFQ